MTLAGLGLAASLFAAPLAASANTVITLPNATWSGFINVPSFPPKTLTTTPVTGPGLVQGGLGNSYAGVSSAPIPSPKIHARVGGVDLAEISGGQAHLNIEYFMEIVGPGNGLAPLNVVGGGGVSSFNGGVGSASLDLRTPGHEYSAGVTSTNGQLTFADATNGLNLNLPDGSSFSINGTGMFPINTVIQVDMLAIADSDFELGPSTGEALIDPVYRVDPSFPNASQYSIVLSPGIGNSAVPEPAAWATMLLGLAALGAALRRCPVFAASPA
jgi:hypothetical protein